MRQSPTGQAGARAAGDEGHLGLDAGADHRLNLAGGLGKRDDRRHHLVDGQSVAFVGPQLGTIGEHLFVADRLPQPLRQTLDVHRLTACVRMRAG